jgi:lipopolysaccharide export system protein LptA
MKKFALATVLLAASVVLVGCTAFGNGSGPTAGPTPATTSDSAGCVNGEADFTTANTKHTLTSVCAKVVISGNNITLTAADVTHLTVSGNHNSANVAVLGDATIVGMSNVIKTTTVGPLSVSGNSNTVTALGPIGDVVVTGANDTVTTPATIGKITQSGIGNKIGTP